MHGKITPRIEELGDMIRTVDTCKVTDNLWGERWSKLCVNGMHNGVSAASGLSGNAMRQDDRIRQVIVKLGGEAARIGQAQGYRLEDIAGQDADKLIRASEGDKGALEEVEALMLALRNSQGRSEAQRPSMGQDMQKGRRTEIDFINGVIVDRGKALGLATRTHEQLIAAVKQVEAGKSPPGPEAPLRDPVGSRAALPGAPLKHRPAEAEGGVDQRKVAEGLREIAEQPLRARVPHLRQEPDIVGEADDAFQIGARLAVASLHAEAVGEPAGAGDERAFVGAVVAAPAAD